LENEREELTAAYKEAEAVSVIGMKLIKVAQNRSVMHHYYSLTYPLSVLLYKKAFSIFSNLPQMIPSHTVTFFLLPFVYLSSSDLPRGC